METRNGLLAVEVYCRDPIRKGLRYCGHPSSKHGSSRPAPKGHVSPITNKYVVVTLGELGYPYFVLQQVCARGLQWRIVGEEASLSALTVVKE